MEERATLHLLATHHDAHGQRPALPPRHPENFLSPYSLTILGKSLF
jgi:hypothetical protein